jgi:hypothetical protein
LRHPSRAIAYNKPIIKPRSAIDICHLTLKAFGDIATKIAAESHPKAPAITMLRQRGI